MNKNDEWMRVSNTSHILAIWRVSYKNFSIKGSNLKVKFNDWIYKQDSNVAINRAYVSKFGIDIGSVTLVFLKGQTAKTVSPLNINSW